MNKCKGRQGAAADDPKTAPKGGTDLGPGELDHHILTQTHCRDNIECEEPTPGVTDECYVCFWIVRTWPAWQDICKPAGVTQKGEFLEIAEETHVPTWARKRGQGQRRGRRGQRGRRAQGGRGGERGTEAGGGGQSLLQREADERRRLSRAMALVGQGDNTKKQQSLLIHDAGDFLETRSRTGTQQSQTQHYKLTANQYKTSPEENAMSLENDGRGVGSRALVEDRENLPDGMEWQSKPFRKLCWKFWDQIERTQRFRYYASLRIDSDLSPREACRCMGVCPYDGLKGAVFNQAYACNYQPDTCCVGLFPDIQIYDKPGTGELAMLARMK